jgi:hypothetical protein
MEDLIEALQIFLKYGNPDYPTTCEHDIMYICGINSNDVSDDDKIKLEELGFEIDNDFNQFYSDKYGSA